MCNDNCEDCGETLTSEDFRNMIKVGIEKISDALDGLEQNEKSEQDDTCDCETSDICCCERDDFEAVKKLRSLKIDKDFKASIKQYDEELYAKFKTMTDKDIKNVYTEIKELEKQLD